MRHLHCVEATRDAAFAKGKRRPLRDLLPAARNWPPIFRRNRPVRPAFGAARGAAPRVDLGVGQRQRSGVLPGISHRRRHLCRGRPRADRRSRKHGLVGRRAQPAPRQPRASPLRRTESRCAVEGRLVRRCLRRLGAVGRFAGHVALHARVLHRRRPAADQRRHLRPALPRGRLWPLAAPERPGDIAIGLSARRCARSRSRRIGPGGHAVRKRARSPQPARAVSNAAGTADLGPSRLGLVDRAQPGCLRGR